MVSVGKAPEIEEDLEDILTNAEEEVTLECTILPGDPKAEIHWYKEAKEIYAGKRHKISYTNDVAKLVIPKAELADGGTYSCEAANKIGRVSTECKVIVTSTFILWFIAACKWASRFLFIPPYAFLISVYSNYCLLICQANLS